MSDGLARSLARAIKDPDPSTSLQGSTFRTATVTAVASSTVTVQFPDGASVAGVTRLLSYNLPQVGDVVRVEQHGPVLLVVDRVVAASASGDALAFRSRRVIISNNADTEPAQVTLNDTKSGQATPNKYLRSVGGKFEVVNNAYTGVIMSLTDTGDLVANSSVLSGYIRSTGQAQIDSTLHAIGSIEVGPRGSASTPFIDFHSGATDVDFDARIIASGGSGAAGGGALTIEASTIVLQDANVSAWNTYTPTTTGLTSGAASGKWRWVSPDVIHLVLTITAGTLTNNTVLPTLSLPSGFTTMSSYTQPLKGMFNSVQLLNAWSQSAETIVRVSHSNAVGTAYANGTSYAGVRIAGTLARD